MLSRGRWTKRLEELNAFRWHKTESKGRSELSQDTRLPIGISTAWLIAFAWVCMGSTWAQSASPSPDEIKMLDQASAQTHLIVDGVIDAQALETASFEAVIEMLNVELSSGRASLSRESLALLVAWVESRTTRWRLAQAAEAYFLVGRLIFGTGPDEQALEFFLRAAQLSEGDPQVGIIQRWVGDVHAVTGAYRAAVDAYVTGLQVDDIPLSTEIELMRSLGDVSRRLQENTRALEYFAQAESLARDGMLDQTLAEVLLGQAAVHRQLDQNETALEIYEEGLALALETDDVLLHAMFYNNLGNVLRDMGEYASALSYFSEALAIAQAQGVDYGVGINHVNQAVVYYLQGDYVSALEKYQLAEPILNSIDRPYAQRSVYEGFAYVYQALGQYQQAFDALMRFNELNSSLLNKEIQAASEEIQTRYETLLKDSELALQAAEIREQKQTLQQAVVVIVALVVIAGGLAFFLRYRNEKYRVLYQRNKELMLANARARQAREAQRLAGQAFVGQSLKPDESSPVPVEEESEPASLQRLTSLYERLVNLFEEDKVYTRPDVSIEEIAKQLGSNRTYVSQAISKVADMSFRHMVNFYRVNEARRLLHEDDRAWSSETLAAEVGYGSTSSLYRAFSQHVGMSPARYVEAIRTERQRPTS